MAKRTVSNDRTEPGNGTNEPVGIVISSGSRREDSPRFAAYVWGPVPETELTEELVAVA